MPVDLHWKTLLLGLAVLAGALFLVLRAPSADLWDGATKSEVECRALLNSDYPYFADDTGEPRLRACAEARQNRSTQVLMLTILGTGLVVAGTRRSGAGLRQLDVDTQRPAGPGA